MIARKHTHRPAETTMTSRDVWRALTRRRRVYILLIETVLILSVALIGHITGRELSRRQLLQRDLTIQQLREERQEVSAELNQRADRISALTLKLNEVQGVLNKIVPSENIFVVRPNQSLNVADGRVHVGLVGSPTIQGVNININGTQRLLNAGDVVNVDADQATTCGVTVQSFDMFTAILHATCTPKPQ
ncbi:MAG: hypothetical protein AB7V13_18055 [Pseudorhodoplanes sp.]|uniref:hypothetical protein n=1 Tax=Pseudorhodoplanes sp. TaxID=1934341 RepID=UPI003D13A97C